MNLAKCFSRVLRVLVFVFATHRHVRAIPALQRRHGLLAFLTLAFFALLVIGGSVRTQFAYPLSH